jgi:hypothetical protein
MSSAIINSIIARAIMDSRFLEQLTLEPESALHTYKLDARSYADFLACDIERLRNFAAFIAMVQHNHLWESFHYTRMLLHFYDLELSLFRDYLKIHQQNRANSRLNRDQRTEIFLTFLRDYVDGAADAQYPGLVDVLAHEKLIWEIKRCLSAEGGPQPPASLHEELPPQDESLLILMPAVNGVIRTHHFGFDPVQIISSLQEKNFTPAETVPDQRILCYWGKRGTHHLQVFEIDYLTSLFLALVDGKNSIADMIQRLASMAGLPIPVSHFRPFLELAFQSGLLRSVAS